MIDLSTASETELKILRLGLSKLKYWHMTEANAKDLFRLNDEIKSELGKRFLENELAGRENEVVVYNEDV